MTRHKEILKQALAIQIEAGVEDFVSPDKAIWKSRTPAPSVTKKLEPPLEEAVAVTPTNIAISDMEKRAHQLASAAATLDDLRKAVEAFDGLAIRRTATNTVFADGNPTAPIMLIGEAPGANEDVQGIPFCGDSGQLMDDLFSWAGMSRMENLYISNTIFWRPPGNRRPTPEELAACRPFVEKHIALINPKIVVLVGGTATASILGAKQGISRLRGTYKKYRNEFMDAEVDITAVFHPSFLLRQPLQKRTFWFDILRLKEHMERRL